MVIPRTNAYSYTEEIGSYQDELKGLTLEMSYLYSIFFNTMDVKKAGCRWASRP